MSNQKQYTDPNDPLYYAPPWLNERNEGRYPLTAANGNGRDPRDFPAQRRPDQGAAYSRRGRGPDIQDPDGQDPDINDRDPPDIFAEAVAKALQQELEPEFVEVPAVLRDQRSFGLFAKVAMALGGAALVALAYVLVFPESEDGPLATLPTWQSVKSSIFPAPQRRPASTLLVQDGSGPVDEPLLLGVSVNDAGPGATVTIDRMPAGARLTAGKRMSASEWRVPAQQISETSIIPPSDFVGEMNLSAALRGSEGATLATSSVRLSWSSTAVSSSKAIAALTDALARPAAPVAAAPPSPQAVASAVATAPPDASQTRAEPAPELPANEIAAIVSRARELMASGDVQAARLLLIRAARAHDARAALFLAWSFDPNAAKQSSTGDPGPDLEQARNWYQKAREWGAPEAQRQLDALARYR